MGEINLTIYRIKRKLERSSIIKKIKTRKHHQIQLENRRFDVYAKERDDHPPTWHAFFEGRLPPGFFWDADGPAVVLLVDTNEATFALTFGQGRHLLDPNSYEEHFGRKVVINSVGSVRSISKKSFDAILGQTITQAAFDTEIGEFGMEIEKELLRGVAGTPTPENKAFGSKMSGIDALAVSVDTDIDKLPDLLDGYARISKSKKYVDLGFEFVDHMAAVNSPNLIEELNNLLLAELNRVAKCVEKNQTYSSEIYLTVPDVVDFGLTTVFAYSTSEKFCPRRSEISLTDFLAFVNSRKSDLSVDRLKAWNVTGFDAGGNTTQSWPVFRCLTGNVPKDKSRFVLSDGHWYRIAEDYLKDLDRDIAKIPRYSVKLPKYKGGSEEDYCKSVPGILPDFHYFNTEWIRPYSRQKYEFCDLYTEVDGYRDMVHAKRGIAIGPLSHMLSQGKVSTEVYYGYDDCRKQVEEKVANALGPTYYRKGRPTELRTVYAIISRQVGYLTFFSKVNLRAACNELRSSNRHFALAWIGFDPAYEKTIKPSKK